MLSLLSFLRAFAIIMQIHNLYVGFRKQNDILIVCTAVENVCVYTTSVFTLKNKNECKTGFEFYKPIMIDPTYNYVGFSRLLLSKYFKHLCDNLSTILAVTGSVWLLQYLCNGANDVSVV